jgi:hypothetical protein
MDCIYEHQLENMSKIYIPRVDLCHDKAYIIKAFIGFGDVQDVILLPKKDANGNEYNGAIVDIVFNMDNLNIQSMIAHFNSGSPESFKFFHYKNRFWYINEYAQKQAPVDTSSFKSTYTDSLEDVEELKKQINQLKFRLLSLESRCEKQERDFMDQEGIIMGHSMHNNELKIQLQHANNVIEARDKEIELLKAEVHNQKCMRSLEAIKLLNKDNEINELKTEVKTKNLIINKLGERIMSHKAQNANAVAVAGFCYM